MNNEPRVAMFRMCDVAEWVGSEAPLQQNAAVQAAAQTDALEFLWQFSPALMED